MLADLASYTRWNPFIIEASGTLEPGSTLQVRIKPPGRRSTKFSPVVTRLEPERLLEWKGRLAIPGLFDGTHRFELDPTPAGTTRFIQSETFSGVLVGLMEKMLRDSEVGFDLMNRALAARVAGA